MNEETDQFERRLIERAESGNAEAGRAVLQQIISAITAGRFDSPVLPFLAKCLSMFLHDGVGLERALCVEDEPSKGGARRKYDTIELAAVDILLRRHRQFSSEDAIKWTAENIGADRKTVHRARNECDRDYNKMQPPPHSLMETLSRDDLLHLSGSYRHLVGSLFPKDDGA